MAKQGMARPQRTHTQPRNNQPPVPELQGKAKRGKEPANPIIAGTSGRETRRLFPVVLFPAVWYDT